jgi:ribosomal-protein-alanine N-acetyltransferase
MTTLRLATPHDIPCLIDIESSVSGTKVFSPMLTEEEWLREMGKSTVYIIEKNSEVMGNVSFEKKEDGQVYFSGLVIYPKFQGRGIGRQVMNKLFEQLKDIKIFSLVTHLDNIAALKLYQSLGFVVKERVENYFGDGEPRLKLEYERK